MKLKKKFKKLLSKLLIFTLFLATYRQTKSMDIAVNPKVIAEVLTAASGLAVYMFWKNNKNFTETSRAQDFLNEAQYSNTPKNETEIYQDVQLKLNNLPYSSQSLLNNTPFGHQSLVSFFKEKYAINLEQDLSKNPTQGEIDIIPEPRSKEQTIIYTSYDTYTNPEQNLAIENARTEKLNKAVRIFAPEKLRIKNPTFNFNFNQNNRTKSQVNIKVDPSTALLVYAYISNIFKTSAIREVQRKSLELTLNNNAKLKNKHHQALNQIIKFACKTFNFNANGMPYYKSFESRYKNILLLNNVNKTNSDNLSILGCKSEALNNLVRLLNKIYFDENGNILHAFQVQKREPEAKDLILSFIENVASDKNHYKQLVQLASEMNPAFTFESNNAENKKFEINYDNGFWKSTAKYFRISERFTIGGISSDSILNNRTNKDILKTINYCSCQALSKEDNIFFDKAKDYLDDLDNNDLAIGYRIIDDYKQNLNDLKKEAEKEIFQNPELKKYILDTVNHKSMFPSRITTDIICNNQTAIAEEESHVLSSKEDEELDKLQKALEKLKEKQEHEHNNGPGKDPGNDPKEKSTALGAALGESINKIKKHRRKLKGYQKLPPHQRKGAIKKVMEKAKDEFNHAIKEAERVTSELKKSWPRYNNNMRKHIDEALERNIQTKHGNKHVKIPDKITKSKWKEIIESTRHGDAQYKPGVDVKRIQIEAWEKGIPVKNGKFKVMKCDKTIGAKWGKETCYIRVEESAGTIHGHPIPESEFMNYIRKAKANI